MNAKGLTLTFLSIIAVIAFAAFPLFVYGLPSTADAPVETFLPVPGFVDGWVMKGKAENFDKETLYKHALRL
jgi:hypothetical protein